MKLGNQLLQLLIVIIVFVIAMMVCLFYEEKDYYQKQLRQEAWENAHHSTFDDELLEHYGVYYDVTEDILDSLNNIYHWRDSCKDERYYQTKDVLNEYWNCCHE